MPFGYGVSDMKPFLDLIESSILGDSGTQTKAQ